MEIIIIFLINKALYLIFLTVFENDFIPQPNLSRVRFKCSFTIINCHPAPRVGFVEVTNSKVWQTSVYEGVYFNEYVKANLARDILKHVIINGMSGSSWRFKKFDRLSLTATSGSSWRFKKFDRLSLTATSLIILVINFDVKSWNLFKGMLKLMEMICKMERDLQEALCNHSMSTEMGEWSDPENFVPVCIDEVEYEYDKKRFSEEN